MIEIVVRSRGAGSGDGVEAGAFGGDAAGVRVFEGDGFVGAEAEMLEDEFVEIGLGFGRGNVFAAGEEGEAIKEAYTFEVGLDPRVFGVGSDGDVEAGGAGFVEEGDHAGERQEFFEATFFQLLTLGFEIGVDGGGTEGDPGVESEINVADGAEKEGFVEGDLVRGVDVGVGADEGGLGVEDETVEVEDEGADHGCPRSTRNDAKGKQEAMEGLDNQAGGEAVDAPAVVLFAEGGHAGGAFFLGVGEEGFAFAGVVEEGDAEAAGGLDAFDLGEDELAFAGKRGPKRGRSWGHSGSAGWTERPRA